MTNCLSKARWRNCIVLCVSSADLQRCTLSLRCWHHGPSRKLSLFAQHRPWEDPLPEAGERHLAQELRGVGLTTYEQPAWKTAALGKATTYGMSDSRSIKEQRESLPIYKLKDQLIQAVNDNQVHIKHLLN